ncbi:MAG: hydantoinase/oxoprolinase family protein [Burkholderiaceae bacterium]
MRGNDFEVARVFRFKKGSGLPLKIPVIDMIEIGAGGGSIARLDRLGLLQIGPDSASADPGPACYGRGGMLPTVTDADLVLGYLGADSFLGGDMTLDVAAARRAIAEQVARPLGLGIEAAAWGIHDLVNENMARASSIHALESPPHHRLHDAADRRRRPGPRGAHQAGAGAGALPGRRRRRLGVRPFLAAPTRSRSAVPGIFSAQLQHEAVLALIDDLHRQGEQLLDAATSGERQLVIAAAMRYVGQGYEMRRTAHPADDSRQRHRGDGGRVRGGLRATSAAPRRRWRSRSSPGASSSAGRGRWTRPGHRPPTRQLRQAGRRRRAWFDGGWHDTPVFRRKATARRLSDRRTGVVRRARIDGGRTAVSHGDDRSAW